jgi:hypothetical protein
VTDKQRAPAGEAFPPDIAPGRLRQRNTFGPVMGMRVFGPAIRVMAG